MKTQIKKYLGITLGAAAIAVGSFLPVPAFAWGPERTTYTQETPADHVVFNSITNNTAIGDERNFVRIVDLTVDDPNKKYSDTVEAIPGHEYEVYIGYHNNAKSSLNKGGTGIALGAKVQSQFPHDVKAGEKGEVWAKITADNADPKSVWDEAYFTTKYDQVLFNYKMGSAKIHMDSKFPNNGQVLPQSLFEDGAYLGLGYDNSGKVSAGLFNGMLPGCAEYSGYITYTIQAENVSALVTKTVSTDGENFSENVNAKLGDVVTFKVEFKNLGTKDLTNVGFHDVFPAGLTLVPDTTIIYNNAHPEGEKLSDLIATNGYNTGLYGEGATATLIYKAEVNKNATCGSKLTNKIFVNHDSGEVADDANVNVVCEDEPLPEKMPTTGPGEVALAVVIMGGIGVGVAYYMRSRSELARLSH